MKSALVQYFEKNGVKNAEKAAIDYKNAFDAMMEGVAIMLDLVGPIQYTYITKSGNKVHTLLDSPE